MPDISVLKTDFKEYLARKVSGKASDIFMGRIDKAIDEAGEDREAMEALAGKLARLVNLFIDDSISKQIENDLKNKITQAFR